MKNIINKIQKIIVVWVVSVCITTTMYSQAPESMSYSAVIRNANQELVSKKNVGIKFSILKSKTDGKAIFVETHTLLTNASGHVSLEIGNGKTETGSFADIRWEADKYFLKTEIDPKGGTDYTIKNTSQLLSVPYALYAKNSGNSSPKACFTHQIGQEKDGGIIYYLYIGTDGKEHGLIVHKKASAPLQWQSTISNTGATSPIDGMANTKKMTNSPAKNYVASLGAGWYIPSIDELRLLGDNRFIIRHVLRKLGGSPFQSNEINYSSNEYDKKQAWIYNFNVNYSWEISKKRAFTVRAIRSF